MAFPTKSITETLIKIAPHVSDAVKTLQELIETLRKPGTNIQRKVEELKQAIELQDRVNTETNEQFKLIKNALENVQAALKISMAIAAGAALIAVIALVVAATR